MACKTAFLVAALSAGVLCSGALAQPAPPNPPSTGFPATNVNVTAQDFVTRAAVSDKYEIRAAKIAQQRSRDPHIARFAARMIADHGQSSAGLSDIVARRGRLALPAELDARHRGMIEQLQTVGPRHFPALYMEQQVQAHEDAVALFASYAGNGEHPRLRRFAAETLPVIRRHLEMARSLSFEVQHAR
jgi:putative membrane protein